MPRLAPAAAQLIQQVSTAKPRSKHRIADEPDGLGFHRAVSFDPTTSRWLAPILEANADPRVKDARMDGNRLVVTFVGTTAADHRQPFEIEQASRVLNEG